MRTQRDELSQSIPAPFVIDRDDEGRRRPVERVKTAGWSARRGHPAGYFVQHRFPDPEEELYSQEKRDLVRAGLDLLEKQPQGRERAEILRKMHGLDVPPQTLMQIGWERQKSPSQISTQNKDSYDFLRGVMLSRGADFSDMGVKKRGRGVAGGSRQNKRMRTRI
jgi:hypothetical protein